MPLAKLFDFLRFELDRPIADLTGLQGFYDIDLIWPHRLAAGSPDPIDVSAFLIDGKAVRFKDRSEEVSSRYLSHR